MPQSPIKYNYLAAFIYIAILYEYLPFKLYICEQNEIVVVVSSFGPTIIIHDILLLCVVSISASRLILMTCAIIAIRRVLGKQSNPVSDIVWVCVCVWKMSYVEVKRRGQIAAHLKNIYTCVSICSHKTDLWLTYIVTKTIIIICNFEK